MIMELTAKINKIGCRVVKMPLKGYRITRAKTIIKASLITVKSKANTSLGLLP